MVKKLKKQYDTPSEGWSEERIQEEDRLIEEYGLKNKKEIYKAQSQLRDLRDQARTLVSEGNEEAQDELIDRVNRLGLVKSNANLEDILTLNATDFLDRRLQTAVDRRGYSDTPNEARQMVVHGHVFIDGQKVNVPSYLLTKEEEKELEVRMPEPEETEDESEEAEEAEEEENAEDETEEESEE